MSLPTLSLTEFMRKSNVNFMQLEYVDLGMYICKNVCLHNLDSI